MNKLSEVAKIVIKAITEEWIASGQSSSSKFIESLEPKITVDDKLIKIEIVGEEYGVIRSNGVKANKVPFTPGKKGSGGGKSKYITGILNWVKTKLGISNEREALGITFAIATKHSRNGIPGSGFLEEVEKKNQKKIENSLIELFEERFEL